MTQHKKLRLVVDLANRVGGFSALGREFQVSSWAVQKWAITGKVPAERVPHLIDLANIHGLAPKPWEIRPDVYPLSLFARFAR